MTFDNTARGFHFVLAAKRRCWRAESSKVPLLHYALRRFYLPRVRLDLRENLVPILDRSNISKNVAYYLLSGQFLRNQSNSVLPEVLKVRRSWSRSFEQCRLRR